MQFPNTEHPVANIMGRERPDVLYPRSVDAPARVDSFYARKATPAVLDPRARRGAGWPSDALDNRNWPVPRVGTLRSVDTKLLESPETNFTAPLPRLPPVKHLDGN
jgi:hypothetical protein